MHMDERRFLATYEANPVDVVNRKTQDYIHLLYLP